MKVDRPGDPNDEPASPRAPDLSPDAAHPRHPSDDGIELAPEVDNTDVDDRDATAFDAIVDDDTTRAAPMSLASGTGAQPTGTSATQRTTTEGAFEEAAAATGPRGMRAGSIESLKPAISPADSLAAAMGGPDLAIVLSHYDFGIIRSIVPFNRGSERTPKLLIRADNGDFLLKCRSGIDADTARVGFSHRVHRHLANRRFPVAPLIESRRSGRFAVLRERRVYELTSFLRGEPFDRSPSLCAESGRTLAQFHRELLDLKTNWVPLAGTCHGVPELRQSVDEAVSWFIRRERAAARRADAGVDPESTAPLYDDMRDLARVLITRYQSAADSVSYEGFDTWPRTVVHADWHPGNLVFRGGQILAVIDLDSVRLAPRVIDLAYGALQFSVRTQGADPEAWPAGIDVERFQSFCRGYDTFADDFILSRAEIRVLPALMIEYLIAESMLNVMPSRRLDRSERLAFLRMIDRKTDWIEAQATTLHNLLDS